MSKLFYRLVFSNESYALDHISMHIPFTGTVDQDDDKYIAGRENI